MRDKIEEAMISSPKRQIEVEKKTKKKDIRLGLREKENYYRGQLELREFYRLQAAVIRVELERVGLSKLEVQALLGLGEKQWKLMRSGERIIPAHIIYRLSILLDKPYQEFFRFAPFKKRGILKDNITSGKGKLRVTDWEGQEVKILEKFNENNKDWQSESEADTESEVY